MKRVSWWILLAAALAALPGATACSAPRTGNEIRFGVWASERGLWDEAIFRWKKAAAADPRSVAALNNLGVAYEKKGMFDEALKSYEAALKIAPDNTYVKSNYKNCQENIKAAQAPEPGKPDAKKK